MIKFIANLIKKDNRKFYVEFFDDGRFVIAFHCVGESRVKKIIGDEVFSRKSVTVKLNNPY
jgi:hypothetical protein